MSLPLDIQAIIDGQKIMTSTIDHLEKEVDKTIKNLDACNTFEEGIVYEEQLRSLIGKLESEKRTLTIWEEKLQKIIDSNKSK